jgi:ankyrin repeat protein
MRAAYRAAEEGLFLPPAEQRQAVADALERAGASTAGRASQELLRAAGAGDAAAAGAALERGADPRGRTPTGRPALFSAAQSGCLELVRLLLEAGADPAVPDPLWGSGTTPLQWAEEQGQEAIAALLR